jgi:hypothetical protein
VRGPIVQLDKLVTQIQSDQAIRSYNKIHEPLSIRIFNPYDSQEHSSTGLNGQFVYSQFLIDCLVRMKSILINKNELISLLKKAYEGNSSQLSIIRESEEDYSCNKAL